MPSKELALFVANDLRRPDAALQIGASPTLMLHANGQLERRPRLDEYNVEGASVDRERRHPGWV